jgi:hypothetical protein
VTLVDSQASARDEVVSYLKNEIWGTSLPLDGEAKPLPKPDADGIIRFKGDEQDVKYFDPETNELLVQGIRPEVLYGTGVLHTPDSNETKPGATDQDEPSLPEIDIPEIKVANHVEDGADEGEDGFALDQSQKLRPSAFGLTFRIQGDSGNIKIHFKGSVYYPVKVQFEGYGVTTWFKKQAIQSHLEIPVSKVLSEPNTLVKLQSEGDASNYVALMIRTRSNGVSSDSTSTTLVAKHLGAKGYLDDVFQATIQVELTGESHFDGQIENKIVDDPELSEINFLYRHVQNFATGHGISVEWDAPAVESQLRLIRTVAVPSFYQEVLTFNASGGVFMMDEIALMENSKLQNALKEIPNAYGEWIEVQKSNLEKANEFSETSSRLLNKAVKIHSRMLNGLETLFKPENSQMLKAFKLANQAMYLQQKHGRRIRRDWSESSRGQNSALTYAPIQEGDPKTYGTWRQFQIGFLLLSIDGLLQSDHEDRLEVDLIFFPTGGGKTEAYLGASALTILYRRLTSKDEQLGTDVLMRYTLRLLTIQQFERSSGLITALEHLRRLDETNLGTKPISIGVWLGAATTPNSRDDVKALYNKGQKTKYDDANPFVLSKCPWCGAAFGWDKGRSQWNGYQLSGKPKTMRFICSDQSCEFADDEAPLPIWITDEDVYDEKPSFILATVDKFARMAWKPEARALFNLDSAGNRVGPPPSLIIQDELHLISGPLGSMVGLYEPVIEELCTDRRDGKTIKPKIIASTATTRKYANQIFALYGRADVTLFPQAISRANETFFSSVDLELDGTPKKGTLYLGVNPATYQTGQMAASVVAAVLLQAANLREETDKDMDYYRTSMWFFNSLRELGMTLTLMNSVVLDRIRGMSLYRRLPSKSKPRWPSSIMELTSRVPSNQIASSLADLSIKAWEKGSVSTCLASSIMEVGVDVGRLGLLTIMSQPKSTAQYIQVSGRVGREGSKGPGLVVMLYNSQRARDRSVYERFNVYHSKLYAQVEPVTVTPFSIPSMRHGLVGALLSYYRMTNSMNATPENVSDTVFDSAVAVLRARLDDQSTDVNKLADFEKQVKDLKEKWARYQPGRWNYSFDEEKGLIPDNPAPALMRARREPLIDYPQDESVLVPSSLRSVDGQTEIKISHNPYAFYTEEEKI